MNTFTIDGGMNYLTFGTLYRVTGWLPGCPHDVRYVRFLSVGDKTVRLQNCQPNGDDVTQGDFLVSRVAGWTFTAVERGKAHEIEPATALDCFLVAMWFDEMPWEPAAARSEWINDNLDNFARETGVRVDDLKLSADEVPLFATLTERLHALNLDTYESDTRFLVFRPMPLEVD